MPSNCRTTHDYIEPPRHSTRTSRETRTSSSQSGVLFGEEVPRRRHVPSSSLRSTFGTTIHIYVDDDTTTRQSSRSYTIEERTPSFSHTRTYSRTTKSYNERDGGRTRSEYRTEQRVPSSRSSRQQSSRAPRGESYEYTRTYRYAEPESFRYAEPEPYRYDAPEDYHYAEPEYSYAESDAYHYTEPEPEFRPRRATCGASGRSRQTYYTEERRPGACCYDSPPEYTSSRTHRKYTPSSTSRTSRTPRSTPSSSSYSSSRSSRSSNTSSSSQQSEPVGVKPHTDLYAVLNLPRNATSAEIKKAYRTLSLRWHPDRCTDEDRDMATEKMAEINQANDVLGDNEKRTYYDCYGVLPAGM